jgi:hypothetical protein
VVRKKFPAEKPFKRAKPPVDVVRLVLHEAGYKCANPSCFEWISMDVHHITYVSDGGQNTPDNLLALCKNCHGKHHAGIIPRVSIRAWKMLRMTINEALDRKTQEVLLALQELKVVFVSGDGMLQCAALVASKMVDCIRPIADEAQGLPVYRIELNDRGRSFIEAWKAGDQEAALRCLPLPPANR